jgi:hypothetical protein
MRSWLPVAALAAVLLPGIGHAVYTGRLTMSSEPAASAARLAGLAADFDGWESKSITIDSRQVIRAELAGYVARVYGQRGQDEKIGVFLACGRPGPISVHTPEICYAGIGYSMVGARKTVTVECSGYSAEFFMATFVKPSPSGEQKLRIYWSWKGDGAWQAPAHARWTFGGRSVLHKLSVIQSLAGADKVSDETCLRFIQALIPKLEKSLFASEKP